MSRRDSTARKAGSQKRGSPSAGDIYRKAAVLIEDGSQKYGCIALARAGGWDLVAAYQEMFYPPDEFIEYHGPAWWANGADSDDEMAANKILALCFMAAIADSEK